MISLNVHCVHSNPNILSTSYCERMTQCIGCLNPRLNLKQKKIRSPRLKAENTGSNKSHAVYNQVEVLKKNSDWSFRLVQICLPRLKLDAWGLRQYVLERALHAHCDPPSCCGWLLHPFQITSRFDFLVHLFCYVSRHIIISNKMDVPKKSKRLIIWNGGSTIDLIFSSIHLIKI